MRCQVAMGTIMVTMQVPIPITRYTRWRIIIDNELPELTAATSEEAEVIMTRPRPSSARQPASMAKSISIPRPLISGEGNGLMTPKIMTSPLRHGRTGARALHNS